MTLKLPRRSDTPMPLRVEGLQAIMQRAPSGNSSISAALTRIATAYASVVSSTGKIMADATLTAPARSVRSARNARLTLGPAMAELSAAREKVSGARLDMQKRINKPFDYGGDGNAAMLAWEIREHFKSLPHAQRMDALKAASDNFDITTMKAIGAAPAYLSGLPPEMHAITRGQLVDLFEDAKGAREALAALDEQEEFASMVEGTVLKSVADLIDFREADSFAAAATDAIAA